MFHKEQEVEPLELGEPDKIDSKTIEVLDKNRNIKDKSGEIEFNDQFDD